MKRALLLLACLPGLALAQTVTDLVTVRQLPRELQRVIERFQDRPVRLVSGTVIRAYNAHYREMLACENERLSVFNVGAVQSNNPRRSGFVLNALGGVDGFGGHGRIEMSTGPDHLRDDDRDLNLPGVTTVGIVGKTVTVYPDRVELSNVVRGPMVSTLFSLPIPITRYDITYTFPRGADGRFLSTVSVYENAHGRTGWERRCELYIR